MLQLMYLLTILVFFFAVFFFILKKKNMDIWFFNYLIGVIKRSRYNGKRHIMFCFVDHFEPQWANPNDINVERTRVDRWFNEYPEVAAKHKDADGCFPKHTFFYPEEEYREEHLEKIADLCAKGFGEIEVHLHHDNDTSSNFRETLEKFTQTLHNNHGAFTYNENTTKLNYSFIHGNWTLCNSHSQGKWCGVNDELVILKETGCYADFTFPSAPSNTQPTTINKIYYAKDQPGQTKSHDKGVEVSVGKQAWGDLMMISGPLAVNWKQRKKGIIPQIENSDIRASMPPNESRIDLWVKTAIQVKNNPDWLFIKIHTHGTQEGDMDTLLGEPFDKMCDYLEKKYNDGDNYVLHYVSAREMYNIIKAAEAGERDEPGKYRNYIIKQPAYHLRK